MSDWDKQPGETEGDYRLLHRYLELGPARTVVNVVQADAGYTFSYVLQLSRAWLWEERAEAYDAAKEAERAQAQKRLEAEVAQRWAHDQLEISELATQVIRAELLAIAKAQTEGKRVPVTGLTQLMDRAHKWLQIKTGGKTDDVGVGINFGAIDARTKEILQSEEVREALAQVAKG